MRWPIAPTDEFVRVWISLADCSDRRIRECLDFWPIITDSWNRKPLGVVHDQT
jgi:hypothetical protein